MTLSRHASGQTNIDTPGPSNKYMYVELCILEVLMVVGRVGILGEFGVRK